MDYKERVERARKLRETIYAFLQTMANNDQRLDIGSKHSSTSIRYCGTIIMTVYCLADSIMLKMQTMTMLKTAYKVLQEKHLSCRMGRDDKNAYDPMSIIVDEQDAQEALRSILTYYQNETSSSQDKNSALPAESIKKPIGISSNEPIEQPINHEEILQELVDEPLSVDTDPVLSMEKPGEQGLMKGYVAETDQSSKSGNKKILLCADVRLGAVSTEKLDIKQSQKWQAARNEKFEDLIDQAAQNNATYIALFGRLFGQERVTESVIDTLFQAVREDSGITVLVFLSAIEHKRVSYRNDVPENLHLINMESRDSFLDDNIALRINAGEAELQLDDNESIVIRKEEDGKYVISGIPDAAAIPSFEPTGFEDAQGNKFGFGILEWTEDRLGQYQVKGGSKYAYKAVELKIMPEDDQKEILRKINSAVRMIDIDTFLRITMTGRSAFGLTMNNDALKNQLQGRIFFVEVYDNTVMDIDEKSFENDISLRSEFVRLALQDSSLSESERNRLISLGWNALSGKEVSAE